MSPSHQTVRLSPGRHDDAENGVCVMELASMLAGEPFSDRPRSVSATLASALRGYNDGLDDDRRQTLKRFAADAIGTNGGRAREKRRRDLIRSSMADTTQTRGLRAALLRRLDAAEPYQFARTAARRVAAEDDEVLHARMLALLDALVDMGGAPTDPGLPAVPAAPPAVRPGR